MGHVLHRSPARLCLAAAIALALPAPASAQDDKAGPDTLEALDACRAITDDSARLACFDREVASVLAERESGAIRVVDAEDIRETRRSLFGFSTPKTGLFASEGEEEKRLQSTITSLRQVRADYWEVTIAEGSVWRASDTPRRFKPKVGDPVELEEAALGSYWLRVDGKTGVKARRIR